MPPPNPDEPASLRRDIADELGDHLACSFARERQRTDDDETARRAVLNRFGDPRKIARRLWLDAMKEVIMNQRTLLTTCIILAAACVATATFSYLSLRQTRQANEAVQKANVAVMGKLEDLSEQAQANSPWSHLEVQFVCGADDGPAIEGVEILLGGKPYNETDETLKDKTDSNGRCRFGPLRPGRYKIAIHTFSRVKRFPYGYSGDVILYPGEEKRAIIKYPEIPATRIGFAPNLPSEFADKDLLIECAFEFKLPDGWQMIMSRTLSRSACFDSNGELYEEQPPSGTTMVFKKVQPAQRFVSWPALDARATYIGIWRHVADGPTTAPYGIMAFYRPVEDSRSPPIYSFSAKLAMENVWKIELPTRLIQDTRAAIPRFASPMQRTTGRLLRTVPVERWGTAVNYSLEQAWRGQSNETFFLDNKGGLQALVKWADIPKEEAESNNRRFILALFSRDTTVGAIPPSQILVHEIVGYWSMSTGQPMPKWSPDPAGRFDFEPGAGWKLFDVTEVVRAQARENRPNYGVLLRFEREDVRSVENPPRWSGYAIALGASNEASNDRPRLLVVEPKK
jgi:hypothetical protein